MINNWRRRDLASPLSEFLGVAILILLCGMEEHWFWARNQKLSSAEFITISESFPRSLIQPNNLPMLTTV
jgi:hypothetical protein